MAIDPEKLKLEILKPPTTKMAPVAEGQGQGGGADAKPTGLQYDPHLHEEKRRADTGQPLSPRIAWLDKSGQRVVDVIAKLFKKDDKPKGLHIVRHIGDPSPKFFSFA